MSRPQYPKGVLTLAIIRAVREEQRGYDKDPDGYERRERQRREEYEREQQELAEAAKLKEGEK